MAVVVGGLLRVAHLNPNVLSCSTPAGVYKEETRAPSMEIGCLLFRVRTEEGLYESAKSMPHLIPALNLLGSEKDS